ncbi:hypothetical protein EST38_g11668 [Candolleomyces aberdarensis]|uniref:Uncharacterized protein n=1 Tax=Candolleomyces aberdarensis TaxID=2316362 RepID=A0A4Q2D6L8_9AGAR|nr:hypothetical protein EST38_g11668 [Candolleomyces aberdarensis]
MASQDKSLAEEGFRPPNAIDLSLDRQRLDPPIPIAPLADLASRIGQLPKRVVFDKSRGGFWVCVHEHPLPQRSDPRESADPRLYIPSHLQNSYPWDAFNLTTGFSDDRLFGTLVMSRSQLDNCMVQNKLGQWMLPLNVRRSWHSLEEKISLVIDAIQAAHQAPTPALNLPIWPSKEGYRHAHGTKNRAVDAAVRSITAFGEVCSFAAFCFSRWKTSSETSPFEPITIYLLSKTNVGHAWLDDLFRSPVGLIPSGGRTGTMVDLLSTPWYNSLHVWAEYGVPLWIWLTGDPQRTFRLSSFDQNVLSCWLPPSEILQKALTKSFPLPPPPQRPLNQVSRVRLTEWEHQAWMAGQWAGESSEIFFNRMRQMMDRHEHDQAPEHPKPPPTWEKIHETSGIRYYHWRCMGFPSLRYHVLDIFRARALYEAHAPSQIFWNRYDNSIDFHWMLDPDVGPTIFDAAGLEDSISQPYEQYQKTTSHTETSHLYERGHRRSDPLDAPDFDDFDDDDESEMDVDEPSSQATAPSQQPLSQQDATPYVTMVSQKRLGYTQDSNSQGSSTSNVKAVVLHNVFGARLDDGIAPSFAFAGSDIINTLLSPVHLSSLAPRWDISTRSAAPPNWKTFPLLIARGSMTEGTDHHRRYIIGIRTKPLEEQWFVVVLYSATSVLQILRFGWTGVLEIVRESARRGIKLRTAKYLARDEVDPQIPKVERVGLGVRYEDSNWAEAYREYERIRDEFLRGPRGKIALMMGGVIGRLARDVVNIKDATKPPLLSSRQHGDVVAIESERSLFGDALTDAEIDIVVGTYRMRRKKKRSPGDQLEYLAQWWPGPATWEKGGLSIGEWSPRCEEWFEKHRSKFRLGKEGPKPRSKWHSDMRLSRETRNVWSEYEELAAKFLREGPLQT